MKLFDESVPGRVIQLVPSPWPGASNWTCKCKPVQAAGQDKLNCAPDIEGLIVFELAG